PQFVKEITARRTRSQDQGPKRGTYAFLGVQEYIQYDPTSDYLRPPMRGLSLVGDNCELMPTTVVPDGTLTLYSNVLGLELRLVHGILRFVDPTTGQRLLSYREAEQARQEAEAHAKRAAAARAEVEARLAAVEAQLRALREQGEGL